MRRFVACLIALAVVAWAGVAQALDPALARLEQGALPEVRPPAVRVEVLPNGMRCFLLPDHTVPAVKVRLILRAGQIYDPPEKVGLGTLAGMLLRSGGAGERSPEAFDAAVDGLGARLSSEMGAEMASLSLEVLSEDLEAGLSLLFDMAFAPRLAASRLDVAKATLEEALRRQDDDPVELVSYKFAQFVYGEESPWARRPSPATLARVRVADIHALHSQFFKSGNMLLAAAGDFDPDALVALLRKLTAEAPQGSVVLPEVAPVALSFEKGTRAIDRPTTQAFIRMGHLGIKRQNPDKFALYVLDEILGGGFKSRLMEDIRTRRGLAYSVWSDITPSTEYGLFTIGVTTKANQAPEAMALAAGHVERLAKGEDIAPSEIAFAKRSILSRLIFEFDRAFKVVDARARFFFYGYPDDYWRIYRDRIVAATKADLERVGRTYLHPEGLKSVVVGPTAKAAGGAEAGREGTAR
jgi:zinc protease